MSNFSVGDLVRIDFGSFQDREALRGVFVHPSMRPLQGTVAKVFLVRNPDSDDVAYKLCGTDGESFGWTFLPEWLSLAEPGATVTTPEPEMIEDYAGNMLLAQTCLQLTAPSEHEGKWAHRAVVSKVLLENGNTVYVLDSEYHDLIVEVEGDAYLRDDIDECDTVEAYGGNYGGQLIWLDNSIFAEDVDGHFHESDAGEYVFYHENRDAYYTYEPEQGTLEYHAQQSLGYINRTNAGTLYTIGFEVEKEDEDIFNNYTADDTSNLGWSREHDGSLDEDTGYELVSPIYDLFDSKLEDEIAASQILRDHINADASTRCGGHINFGKVGTSGSQLLKECAAFLPLFVALYRKRVLSRWASMRVDINEYDGSDRYVAFNVKREYIEFRLIARVHDVDTMLWRRDLFRIMASNPNIGAAKVQQMMLDRRSALHKLLRKMYTEEKLLRLACWYSQFADAMFDTLQFSKTGHGVMMDFFVSSLRRSGKRVGVSIEAVEGWVEDVHFILSRARGGDKYANNVKKLDRKSLKFLQVKG